MYNIHILKPLTCIFILLTSLKINAKEFNSNQLDVLEELQEIQAPTANQLLFLTQLDLLPEHALQHTLNQLSGEQFTTIAISHEIAGNNFLRSLYNPLRHAVITFHCPYTCCLLPETGIWVQAQGGQSFINNCRHANDTKCSGCALSVGAQTVWDRNWTIGLAASFSKNTLDFNRDGNGDSHYGFAGIYGLYRTIGHYVMADFIYGVGHTQFTRRVGLEELRFSACSKTKSDQIAGYIEAGMDCPLWCLLVQPFLGLEANGIFCGRIRENGHFPFKLSVSGHSFGNAYSRLGAHITLDQCFFLVSLDVVWKYQLNPSNHRIEVRFQDFGDKFHVKDVKRGQSYFEGALAVVSTTWKNIELYGEASGFVGYHSVGYQVLGGIQYKW